ncbi:sensor histidine kinase [Actinokineospora soli]|uniref:Sensor histidine kinase n=1 Tax=Actinokineospora soli TaxID=1048753 RepID=A0ABW2TMC5_9PSEU
MRGEPLAQVRRYVWLTTLAAAVAVGMMSALILVGRGTAVDWLVFAPATAVVALLYVRLTLSAMPGLGTARTGRWDAVAAIAASGAAWWYSGFEPPWATLPAMAIAGIAAVRRGRARSAVIWGGSLGLAGVSLLVSSVADPPPPEGGPLLVLLITAIFAGSNVLQVWLWEVVVEIDRGRQLGAELAVARERLRFASDLHDIQGHHLQAIALKAELAERLIGHDDAAARTHAAEVGDLARTALRETRDVVRGYRRSDLATEIGNAVQVLRAAGIDAAVDGDPAAVPPPLQTLFGALVREGTTNVLRHSAADTCTVSVAVDGRRTRVTLSNDGVDPDREPRADGSGLDGLRERFATVGGALQATRDGARFQLTGEAVAP